MTGQFFGKKLACNAEKLEVSACQETSTLCTRILMATWWTLRDLAQRGGWGKEGDRAIKFTLFEHLKWQHSATKLESEGKQSTVWVSGPPLSCGEVYSLNQECGDSRAKKRVFMLLQHRHHAVGISERTHKECCVVFDYFVTLFPAGSPATSVCSEFSSEAENN